MNESEIQKSTREAYANATLTLLSRNRPGLDKRAAAGEVVDRVKEASARYKDQHAARQAKMVEAKATLIQELRDRKSVV